MNCLSKQGVCEDACAVETKSCSIVHGNSHDKDSKDSKDLSNLDDSEIM